MKYLKKDCGAYNIHVIKTDKFKTITIEVNFLGKVKKDEITIRNVLSEMLVSSSKKYPTKRLLAKRSNQLYGANIKCSNSRVGNYIDMSYSLSFLNEKYTESGMNEESIKFLFETLFNPNIKNNKFDKNCFQVVKNQIKEEILSVRDNKTKYSLIKMLGHMGDDPYSYIGYGYMEDLNIITEENLYDYYLNLLKNEKIDIFVVGDFDDIEIINLIKNQMIINTKKKSIENIIIEHDKINLKSKEIKDFEPMNQAKLSIGIKLPKLSFYESRYVLPIYNEILGGGTDSKLFKIVREKNSLCYYINSVVNLYDNILTIYSGINKSNYNKTIDLIKKQMVNIRTGKITSDEINLAKKSMINSVNTINDSVSRILSLYYTKELIGSDDCNEKIKNINKVTVNDVINLSKKIKLDTIYLMYGDE